MEQTFISAPRCALALLVAAGCAHRTVPSQPPAAEVLWPAPPATPHARFEREWRAGAAGERRSGLRRFFDAVAGIEDVGDERASSFRRPFGVALSPMGVLAVADPDAQRVTRIEGGGEELSIVTCEGREWVAPMALAFSFGGDLVVADAGAGELVRVPARGRCAPYSVPGLQRPTGLAVSTDRLYVADPPSHAVLALDSTGTVVQRFGGRGAGDGQLNFPTGVAVAANGELLVLDSLNFRVARFSPDGRWLGSFGSAGDDEGFLARPKGLGVSADGRVFVSDFQRDSILVFQRDGTFAYAIGAAGDAPGFLHGPAGLAVTGDRLVVADSLNGRVQSFALIGGST